MGIPRGRRDPRRKPAGWGVVLALAGCIGCSPGKDQAEETDNAAWTAELVAYARQVGAPIAAAELQPRGDPEPKSYLLRLDEELPRVKAKTRFQPQKTESAILREYGPLRCGEDGVSCETSKGIRRVTLSSLQLQREKIGRILIDVADVSGRWLELAWDDSPPIRIPIGRDSALQRFALGTDGLPHWRGSLGSFHVSFRGGPAATTVERVRFERPAARFARPYGQEPVQLGTQLRRSIFAHATAELTFDGLRPPAGSRFRVGLGWRGRPAYGPLRFRASAARGKRSEPLFNVEVSRPGEWRDVKVDLPAWTAEGFDLRLEATGGDTVAFWSNPTVYQPVEDAPRYVLYLIDALAMRHTSLAGYHRRTTPVLEQLAARGAWFSHMYANAPQTDQSVPSLLLSLYTHQHRVAAAGPRSSPALAALPFVLDRAGFATAIFSTNVNAGAQLAMDLGFETFSDHVATHRESEADRTVPIGEVMRWLRDHKDRPAFVYVHTAEPHDPYVPPDGFAGRFGSTSDDRSLGYRGNFLRRRDQASLERVQILYDEEIAYADAQLGAFFGALTTEGLADGTDLLVTADHGEAFGEHGYLVHSGPPYEELLRIPLVVAGPRVGRIGEVETPVQLVDVMPTILDWAEIAAPYPLAGRSIAPLLAGDASARESFAARPIVALKSRRGGFDLVLIEGGRWKLLFRPREMRSPTAGFEVYDLDTDPQERDNLALRNPATTRRLIERLFAWKQENPPLSAPPPAVTPRVELEAEVLEQLRSMGYIE